MYVEPLPPKQLKQIQHWFGEMITRPLLKGEKINPLTLQGLPIEKEAASYLLPSPFLKVSERLQIYNQLYWRRLLQVMQDTFPTTLRLFHYRDFNRLLAIPYLKKYPPTSWSLNDLGNHFVEWIKKEYVGNDKQLVLGASEVDRIFNESFIAKEHPTPKIEKSIDLTKWMNFPLQLQPHVFLIASSFDLLTLRAKLLDASPDDWLGKEFPSINTHAMHYLCIYRNKRLNVVGEHLSKAAYHFLLLFQKGCTLEQACDWLQEQPDEIVEEASKHLSNWLKNWIRKELFILGNK